MRKQQRALSRLLAEGEHGDDDTATDTVPETNSDADANHSMNRSNKALQRRK